MSILTFSAYLAMIYFAISQLPQLHNIGVCSRKIHKAHNKGAKPSSIIFSNIFFKWQTNFKLKPHKFPEVFSGRRDEQVVECCR